MGTLDSNIIIKLFNYLSVLNLRELITLCAIAVLVFEQFFYWILGSYPYRYGFTIQAINIPVLDNSTWRMANKYNNRLAIKVNDRRNMIFFRYKYPMSVLGPLLFVGQVQNNDAAKLKIKVGPLSGILFSIIIIVSTYSGNFLQIFNVLFILIAGGFLFYWRLLNNLKKTIKLISSIR